MSLHDEYARITPFEIAFPDREGLAALSAEVSREAAGRRVDASVPAAFVTLGAVGAFVRDLQPADASQEGGHEYGALVFHSVNFLQAGCPLYLLETAVSRGLVEGAPEAEPDLPSPSGYVQLPQHLFWTAAGEGVTPESLDGVFWTVTPQGMLHTLPITGLRPDRAGFGALPLPEAPVSDAPRWLDAAVRAAGEDYASDLPGGNVDRLYSVEAAGEVLKLLARFFAYIVGTPPALEASHPQERQPGGPLPSALGYNRVKWVG